VNFLTRFQETSARELEAEVSYDLETLDDDGGLATELRALRFIRAAAADPTLEAVRGKYVTTLSFLREVLGDELYGLACTLSDRVAPASG
jgi:hypothetical protein